MCKNVLFGIVDSNSIDLFACKWVWTFWTLYDEIRPSSRHLAWLVGSVESLVVLSKSTNGNHGKDDMDGFSLPACVLGVWSHKGLTREFHLCILGYYNKWSLINWSVFSWKTLSFASSSSLFFYIMVLYLTLAIMFLELILHLFLVLIAFL